MTLTGNRMREGATFQVSHLLSLLLLWKDHCPPLSHEAGKQYMSPNAARGGRSPLGQR